MNSNSNNIAGPLVKGGIQLEPISSLDHTTLPESRRGSIDAARRMSSNAGIRRESGNYDYVVLNPIMTNNDLGGGPASMNIEAKNSPSGGRKSSLLTGLSGLLPSMNTEGTNSPGRKNSSMSVTGAISGLFRSNSHHSETDVGPGVSGLLNRERVYSNNSDISDEDDRNSAKSPTKTRGGNYGGSFLNLFVKQEGGNDEDEQRQTKNHAGSFVSLFQPMPGNSNPMSRRGSVQDNIEVAIASCHNSHVDLTSLDQIGAALTLQPLTMLVSPGTKNKKKLPTDGESKSPLAVDDKLVDLKPLPSATDIKVKGKEDEGGNLDTSRNTLQTGQNTLPPLTGHIPIPTSSGSDTSRSCNSDGFKVRKETPEHLGSGWEVVLMGWVMVAGGQLYGWNVGFTAGFGSYFIAQMMVGISYCIMLCCIGENTAALCFPGGSYGLTRVVLGFYSGFMVGAFEMMEYVFMCSASVAYMGIMAETTLNLDHKWSPLLWLVFYAFAMGTCCTSLRTMWYTSTTIFVVTMALLLIYLLGSLKYVNISEFGPYWNNTASYVPVMGNNNITYSLDYTTATVVMQADGTNVTMALGTPLPPIDLWNPSYWFVGGMSQFMASLALCTWAFAGVECLVLMVDMVKDPKKNIAVGCAGGVGLLLATNIATVVVCAAMPPGLFVTSGLDAYMSVGYQLMFPNLSDIGAYLMIFPGQLGMGWGFVAPMGKLFESLSASNLLPRFFMLQGVKDHRPGVVVACICGFIINLIGFYSETFNSALQNIAIASAIFAYFANIIAYIKMATIFKQIERDFRSPFGLVGAVFALVVFTLVLISTLFFQPDGFMGGVADYTTLKAMAIIIVFLTMYYYAFVVGTQKFSNAEQKTVFRLHVFVFNSKKGNKGTSGKTSRVSPWFYQRLWNGFDSGAKRFSKAVDTIADAFYSRQFERIVRVLAPSMLKEEAESSISLSRGVSSKGTHNRVHADSSKGTHNRVHADA